MRTFLKGIVAVLLLGCGGGTLRAQDPRQIVQELERRSQTSSQHYEGSLVVTDRKGKVNTKRWIYDEMGSHGNSKVVIRFTAPAEVKGVALLIENYPERSSDQWMWTPAIGRERRIAIQDRSTRFFGTDFSFEDLEERDVDQYGYTLKGEEVIDGDSCWRIDARPLAGKRSQYTHSVLWIRKQNYTYALIENYMDDKLIRRIRYRDLQDVQNIWTARLLEVLDLTRNSTTQLRLESLHYNAPVRNEDFTIQALRVSE
jgi:hypothetical protein